MQNTNDIYKNLLSTILNKGDLLTTRNSEAYSYIEGLQVKFNSIPLVTIRKTAWKKALLEMEWFLSGNSKCPDELLDWWEGQLNPNGCYFRGYGHQLTDYTSESSDLNHYVVGFNQINWLINAIKHSPNSRRLIITTWHPEEMSRITEINENKNTPTTCHLSFVQFFVRNNKLYMLDIARSQDLILGTPHNWVQHWALLMYIAYKTSYKVGGITYTFGDAHIYNEPSHIEVANMIINCNNFEQESLEMIYTPTSDKFKASDFQIIGNIAEPITKIRPKLL
jgi:thymidylate synthase